MLSACSNGNKFPFCQPSSTARNMLRETVLTMALLIAVSADYCANNFGLGDYNINLTVSSDLTTSDGFIILAQERVSDLYLTIEGQTYHKRCDVEFDPASVSALNVWNGCHNEDICERSTMAGMREFCRLNVELTSFTGLFTSVTGWVKVVEEDSFSDDLLLERSIVPTGSREWCDERGRHWSFFDGECGERVSCGVEGKNDPSCLCCCDDGDPIQTVLTIEKTF